MAVRGRKTRKRTAKKLAKRVRKAAAVRGPKTETAATRTARKVAPASSKSEIARLRRELRVARDRQAASAEILRAIAASSGDALRSLQQIAETAERLFVASAVTIRIAGEGNDWSHIVNVGAGAKLISARVSADQLRIGGHNMPSVVYLENRVVHLPDLEHVDPEIADWPGLKPSREAGTRTLVGIPLRRDGKAIGSLIVHRKRVAAFTDDELELLQSFADQAVIAIQNARLFNETQEALARQTATAEILSVISRSPTDLRPVFSAIVVTAARLLKCDLAFVLRCDATSYSSQAIATREGLLDDPGPANVPIDPDANFPSRTIVSKQILHLPDWSAIELPEHQRRVQERYGVNSSLFVPMLRNQECIGLLALGRRQVGAFSASDISLAQSFADQALIAIENARLFNETREALERQTATAEILKVIASSPTDVDPVLETIVERARELCEANDAAVLLKESDHLRFSAHRGPIAINVEEWPINRGWASGRAVLERMPVHIPDTLSAEEYPDSRELSRHSGTTIRSVLAVPLLREGEAVGSILLRRLEVRPFSDKQIALLQTFADQAVIAIENVRLFNETREALERQTATADILKVIASSPTDVKPVFDAIAERSNRLVGGHSTAVFRFVNDMVQLVAFTPVNPEADAVLKASFPRAVASNPLFKSTSGGELVQTPDIEADEFVDDAVRELARSRGFRSRLLVPLIGDNETIGVISVTRTTPGRFADQDVQFLQTFADQAVIAIQNVKLFEEVQARTRDLEESLQQQTATAEVLQAISRSTFDLDAILSTLVETAARLCNAGPAQIFRRDGDVYHYAASRILEPAYREHEEKVQIRAGRGTVVGRMALEKRPVQILDAWQDPEYEDKDAARIGGIRSMLAVPLLRGGEPVGAFALARNHVESFTDSQIKLVSTFADQAVIAIENVRLFNETREALERQTATADILKVIASSPTDVTPVFDAIAERSNRLLGGYSTAVIRFDGEMLDLAAFTSTNPEGDKALRAAFPQPVDNFPPFQLVRGGETVEFADTEAEGVPRLNRDLARTRGYRSMLHTALMGDRGAIGMVSVTRKEPGVFAPHHVQLLRTFADQAVIAIQNVKLFEEVQAKTRDLEEALTYQTGSANILKVIASTPTDVEPSLKAIVESASELCDAYDAAVVLRDGDDLRFSAHHGSIPIGIEKWPINRHWTAGRAFIDQQPVHIHDLSDETNTEFSDGRELAIRMGHRTILSVPLVRDGESIGAIVLRRQEVHPFTERQIGLLQSFADQAVIAIQNVKLFEEVQARTRDLQESLQQQTATADVLKVISRSAFDLDSVMNTLTQSAAELCRAEVSALYLRDGDALIARGVAEADATQADFLRRTPLRISESDRIGRALLTGTVFNIPDAESENDPGLYKFATTLGFKSCLFVPLMRDGRGVGVFALARNRLGEYPRREVDLVQTFADQAVIAIENVRLFDEVQAKTRDLTESLQFQTASADVLKVISRSPDTLQPVLDVIVDTSRRLCNSISSVIFLVRDGRLHLVADALAETGTTSQAIEFMRANPVALDQRGSSMARAARDKATVHIADTANDPEFSQGGPLGVGERRALLSVPLVRDGQVIGGITLRQSQSAPFTRRQIELVETFADQAVIAISNVNLFEQVQARTRELSKSLEDLRAAQDRLVQTEKLASLGQLTAGIAHEIKNPLNFVNNFSALSSELIDELLDVLKPIDLGGNAKQDVDEIAHMLKGNLEKVVQHGKRADSIVKNMLVHSRTGSGEHHPTEINAIVEESLNLAYHGARAEKTGFNITLKRDFDPDAGLVDVYAQEMTRVLLNLISNGFYAATKRKAEAANGFEPTLSASTKNLGDKVEIRVRDNGTGIPRDVKEKMFNPFFTTKPAGEGTGLGLSMSHDIVVKQHQGTIEVETEPGSFTEFIITLPRAAASLAG